jgi:hypothetical protein
MARIRTIKPELFTDPHFCALSHTARVLYCSMLTQADDRGRLDDAPKRLCANAFGEHERVKPEALIAEMARGAEPRILRYEVAGKPFIAIRNFRRHQSISKPQESRILPPPLAPETAVFQGWTPEEERNSSAPVPLPGLEQVQERSTPEVELGSGTGKELEQDLFDRFWKVYPKTDDKRTARTAFTRALKRASFAAILAGAERYRDDPNREPSFTKNASTWLNADAWENGPLPSRNGRGSEIEQFLAEQGARRA